MVGQLKPSQAKIQSLDTALYNRGPAVNHHLGSSSPILKFLFDLLPS